MKVKLHVFSTSVDGGELPAWRYDRLFSRKDSPVTSAEKKAEWNTTETDLEAAMQAESLAPAGNWTLITFLSYFENSYIPADNSENIFSSTESWHMP
jgi:hypothetical protein